MKSSRSNATEQHWHVVRAIVLARDNGRCQECGEYCAKGEADVHHLDASLGATLRLLGVTHFRTPQLEVVLAALRGESLLLVSATGSGKSLCFQVPVLLRRGCAFVISPLKALMSQQVSDLQRKKIPATFINGDLAPQEKEIRYALLRDHALKFLFCTPERFDATIVRPSEVAEITRTKPNYLVIDEAHCIDRWGRDFRPNYGRLREVRHALGDPPVLAFTATAGLESQQRILRSLGVPDARVVVTGVNRQNIALARLDEVEDEQRYALIIELLRTMPAGRAMVFVPTVRIGTKLQNGLRDFGLHVPFFHSKLGTANDRDMLLGRFMGRLEPAANVVICTNAFGMGLDLPNVRLVIHWQHPASVEDYLQEFGRAGRDGSSSIAVLFTSTKDVGLLKYMADQTVENSALGVSDKTFARQAKTGGIKRMQECATARDVCFRSAIVEYFGEAPSWRRKSLAVRIVEWLFSRANQKPRSYGCCDKCDGVRHDNVLEWAAGVWDPSVRRRRAGDSLTARADIDLRR